MSGLAFRHPQQVNQGFHDVTSKRRIKNETARISDFCSKTLHTLAKDLLKVRRVLFCALKNFILIINSPI
jgi:hypothetical protein